MAEAGSTSSIAHAPSPSKNPRHLAHRRLPDSDLGLTSSIANRLGDGIDRISFHKSAASRARLRAYWDRGPRHSGQSHPSRQHCTRLHQIQQRCSTASTMLLAKTAHKISASATDLCLPLLQTHSMRNGLVVPAESFMSMVSPTCLKMSFIFLCSSQIWRKFISWKPRCPGHFRLAGS